MYIPIDYLEKKIKEPKEGFIVKYPAELMVHFNQIEKFDYNLLKDISYCPKILTKNFNY